MINNIINNDILKNPLIQNDEVQEVQKNTAGKNPYQKGDYLVDQSQISNEAIKLFEQEQEINKYKSLVLEALNEEDDSIDPLISLINNDKYNVDDEDLADSLMENSSFINSIF